MAFHLKYAPLAAVCGVLLLAAQAPAQQRDSTAIPDSARARALLLPPLVASVARLPVRPDQVGFGVSVVPARDPTTPVYAADALREVTGVFVEEAAGPGGPTIVRLRGGEEVFTQVLMDGVQVNENGGFFDFQGLALSNLERIEIARGPQSALYGSSAVSGVVHFITPRGTSGPARWSFSTEGHDASGDGAGWRVAGHGSGGNRDVQWSAGAGSAFSRGIYALPHDTRTHDGSLRVDAAPATRVEITAIARYAEVESNLPVRDPGATRAPLDPNARNERSRLVSSLSARIDSPGGAASHRVRASLYTEDFLYADRRDPVTIEDPDIFLFNSNFVQDTRRGRVTIDYAGTREVAVRAALLWGVQWEREAVRTHTDFEGERGSQRLDRSSAAAFAEMVFAPVRGLDLLAGARVEKYQGLDAAWTPRLSAVLDLVRGRLSARAAAGRAYRAPNLVDQYTANPFIASNPDLEPETSVSWEAGLDARDADGRVAAEVTFFRQRFVDLIRVVPLEGSTMDIHRNLGRSRAQGLEWTARVHVTPHITLGTQGAWTETRILDNAGLDDGAYPLDEELPGRPSVVASAWADGEMANGLGATLRVTTVGAQTVLSERFSGSRERLDAHALLGAVLRWHATPRLDMHVRIDNILGAQYSTAFDRQGSPRTAALGFRISK